MLRVDRPEVALARPENDGYDVHAHLIDQTRGNSFSCRRNLSRSTCAEPGVVARRAWHKSVTIDLSGTLVEVHDSATN